MSDQATPLPRLSARPLAAGRVPGVLHRLDAARRLGPRAVLAWLRHAAASRTGRYRRVLADETAPQGPFLPVLLPPAPPIPADAAQRLVRAAGDVDSSPGHGCFDPAAHALALDLFAAGDIRPVWEANRLAALPLLAQAGRLDPASGARARAEALVARWCRDNPPFRGPNWACGQEAAVRALHLALALALLEVDASPPPGARRLLALHARRIAATPHYARAQDNNHPVSEAAGLLVCSLLLGRGKHADAAARTLAHHVARLVAPDGAFAQPSAGYHRLLLDTLALAEWFRRRHGAPPFPAPFAARAAAATRWLHRLVDPATGALPRIGHCDDSALADLGLRGPADARGSLERAARLFCGARSGLADDDAGCAWLGIAPPDAVLPAPEPTWRSEGWRGWSAAGARAVLRTGAPLRFRPAHCDLLHLDLFDGARNLLRDGGTGAYNPGAAGARWPALLWGTAAHNTIAFDDAEQMPRIGRFLLARWPRCRLLPDGAAYRDHTGRTHARRVAVRGRVWTVEDRVGGDFTRLALRWRLCPGPWTLTPDGADGPFARIVVTADASLTLALRPGLESLAYGAVSAAPVLEARAAAPVSRLVTTILLPAAA